MKLIKIILTCAFIAFGINGLLSGTATVFYAIFTLLSIGSLLLSLYLKPNEEIEEMKDTYWTDRSESDKK